MGFPRPFRPYEYPRGCGESWHQRFAAAADALLGEDVWRSVVHGEVESSSGHSLALWHHVGSYEDFCAAGEESNPPRQTVVVCFNAGIWGYETWRPALASFLHLEDVSV